MEKIKTLRISPFISKLYSVVNDENLSGIISWEDENDRFFIKNIDEFIKNVLPKYFKQKNFNLFLKQLKSYNFHRSKDISKGMCFYNNFFKKGLEHSLIKIKRKAKKETSEEELSEGQENSNRNENCHDEIISKKKIYELQLKIQNYSKEFESKEKLLEILFLSNDYMKRILQKKIEYQEFSEKTLNFFSFITKFFLSSVSAEEVNFIRSILKKYAEKNSVETILNEYNDLNNMIEYSINDFQDSDSLRHIISLFECLNNNNKKVNDNIQNGN